MNKWEKLYKKETKKEARYLEQIWDGRRLKYPSEDYLKWLVSKLKKTIKEFNNIQHL